MEVRDAKKYASWYASYTNDQGKSLITCLERKIAQQNELLENILGEIELSEDPKEVCFEVVLNSIKGMIEQDASVSAECGYYKWTYQPH